MLSNITFAIATLFVLSTPIYGCSLGCYQPEIRGPGLLKVKDLDAYNNYEKTFDLINLPNLQCSCRKTIPSFLTPKIDLAENLFALKRKVRCILSSWWKKKRFFSAEAYVVWRLL